MVMGFLCRVAVFAVLVGYCLAASEGNLELLQLHKTQQPDVITTEDPAEEAAKAAPPDPNADPNRQSLEEIEGAMQDGGRERMQERQDEDAEDNEAAGGDQADGEAPSAQEDTKYNPDEDELPQPLGTPPQSLPAASNPMAESPITQMNLFAAAPPKEEAASPQHFPLQVTERITTGSRGVHPSAPGNPKPGEMGEFFASNIGWFIPFLLPALNPTMRKVSAGLPPPFDYLVENMMGGKYEQPKSKKYHTCPPKMPPPFNPNPPPPPPLFPVQTKMPDWGVLIPGSVQVGDEKFDEQEPDQWYSGEVSSKFTPPHDFGTGKIVEQYPTQGIQYPFSAQGMPQVEPLAHFQSPAVASFQSPGIYLELANTIGLPQDKKPAGTAPTQPKPQAAPPSNCGQYTGNEWYIPPQCTYNAAVSRSMGERGGNHAYPIPPMPPGAFIPPFYNMRPGVKPPISPWGWIMGAVFPELTLKGYLPTAPPGTKLFSYAAMMPALGSMMAAQM